MSYDSNLYNKECLAHKNSVHTNSVHNNSKLISNNTNLITKITRRITKNTKLMTKNTKFITKNNRFGIIVRYILDLSAPRIPPSLLGGLGVCASVGLWV